jgi:tRNA G18 (ribose-2'-O)-methylase SpoU
VAGRAPRRPRLALLLGAEGAGLSDATRAVADVEVRIPMAAGVDSLNVAAACGIALHRFA